MWDSIVSMCCIVTFLLNFCRSRPLTFTEISTSTQAPPTSSQITTSSTRETSTSSNKTIEFTTTTSPEAPTTEPDEIDEIGSGDVPAQVICKELYKSWEDPDFPGGKPPPLSPDEEINAELCNYILSVAKETCENEEKCNATICDTYNVYFRPKSDGSTRMKRHRHHKDHTDDEEMLHMLRDEPGREIDIIDDFNDISFNEFDLEKVDKIHQVEIEPKPQAVRASDAAIPLFNPMIILFAFVNCFVVVYIWE